MRDAKQNKTFSTRGVDRLRQYGTIGVWSQGTLNKTRQGENTMYREFRDSREGFDAATAAEYNEYFDSTEPDNDDVDSWVNDDPWFDGVRYFEDNMSDVEANADTLRSCGWGTDEDYGYFGE